MALLATSSSYYAIFFLILIAAAGIFVLVRDRAGRRFFGAAMAGLATVGFMLVNMAPDLLYTAVHGANPGALERAPGETEFYALKLVQLLLPWPGHRIPILAELRQQYDSSYVSLGEQPSLGIVAAAGPGRGVPRSCRRSPSAGCAPRPRGRASASLLVAGLSALVFVAFLFSTLGGLSTLISVFTSSLRGWNRMSIVIMMLCLAVIGLLIDQRAGADLERLRLARAAAGRHRGRAPRRRLHRPDAPATRTPSTPAMPIAFDSDQAFVARSVEDAPTS